MKIQSNGNLETFEEFFERMIALSKQHHEAVEDTINGVRVIANENSTVKGLWSHYSGERERLAEFERQSPQYKAELSAWREKLAREVATGILPFSLVDHKLWDGYIQSEIGEVARYAARIAYLAEKYLASGKSLRSIYKQVFVEADTESFASGSVTAGVVRILARVWRHGEELRQLYLERRGCSGA